MNTEACLKATHLSEHHRTLEKQMHYHSGCLRILQNLHNTLEKKNYDPLLFAILPPLTLPFQTSNQLQSISPITNKWGHGTRTSIFKGIQLYAWKCYCKELHPFEFYPSLLLDCEHVVLVVLSLSPLSLSLSPFAFRPLFFNYADSAARFAVP